MSDLNDWNEFVKIASGKFSVLLQYTAQTTTYDHVRLQHASQVYTSTTSQVLFEAVICRADVTGIPCG